MDIILKGHIVKTWPVEQGVSAKTNQPWAKQHYLIEELADERYPTRVVFSIFGIDRIQEANLHMGDVVTVHLAIKVNTAKDGRAFNNIECWKVSHGIIQIPNADGQ